MTQVLLRTASTLARACSEAVQQIEVRGISRLSVHQNVAVADKLRDLSETAYANIQQVLELYSTRAALRHLIGNANNEVIDRLLVERDELNQTEKYLNDLIEEIGAKGERSARRRMYGLDDANKRVDHDVAQVQTALDNLRQRMNTVTAGDVAESVEVPTLTAAQVKQLQARVAQIRRRRSMVNDQIAAENLKVFIELPTAVETVLRKHLIID